MFRRYCLMAGHRDDLRAADNPSAWILRVAANAIVDHHRRRAAERRALERAGVEQELSSAVPAAEAQGVEADLAECVRPLLRALPDAYAEALLLTEIEGMTQSAAARRPGALELGHEVARAAQARDAEAGAAALLRGRGRSSGPRGRLRATCRAVRSGVRTQGVGGPAAAHGVKG